MSMMPTTEPTVWTVEIEQEARAILKQVMAATLEPGEDIRLELKGLVSEGFTEPSKLSGNIYHGSNPKRIDSIFAVIERLVPMHLLIPPNAKNPPRYSADLLIAEYTYDDLTAHMKVAGTSATAELLLATGLNEKETNTWMRHLRSTL